MGSTRIIATRKQPVFMAHVCSACGCPIITVVMIEAEAQKTYTFSQSKAEMVAGETAENAINEEIQRIEACKRTRSVLVGKIKKSSMISPGHFCDSSFSGFDSACPNCMSLEPWKSSKLSKKNMDELSDDNFPKVFKDADQAETWVKQYSNMAIRQLSLERSSVEDVKKAELATLDSYFELENLRAIRDSISEIKQREQLDKELRKLNTQKDSLGILDFKGKKIINEQIKVLSLRIRDINKIISDKQLEINLKIIAERVSLQKNQVLAFGCTGKIVVRELQKALCYIVEPNEIPNEKIQQYRSSPNGIKAVSLTFKDGASENKYINENEVSPETEQVLFCRKCGFRLLPDSTFCSKCGSKVK